MREMAEVRNLDVNHFKKEDSDRLDAVVVFDDPTLMNDVFFKNSNINRTYTVEVMPLINSVRTKKSTPLIIRDKRFFRGLG